MLEDSLPDFETGLEDLKSIDRNSIAALTLFAEDLMECRDDVAKIFVRVMNRASKDRVLPIMYTMDSCLKNIKNSEYPIAFSPIITQVLMTACRRNEQIRPKLFKVRATWGPIFSNEVLHHLDKVVNQLDPRWEIVANIRRSPNSDAGSNTSSPGSAESSEDANVRALPPIMKKRPMSNGVLPRAAPLPKRPRPVIMDQIRQPKPTPQRVPPTPLLRTPTQQGATNGKPDDQTQKALEALRLLRQTATSQKPAPVVAPSRPLLPGLGPPPAPFTDYSRVPPPQQQAFNLTPSTQKFLRGLARPEQRASPPVGGESRASTADGPKTPDEDDYKSLLDIVNKVTHKKSQYSELNQVDSRVMSCWQWLKNMKMSTTKPKWKSFRDAVLDDELFLFYLVQLGMDCSEESKKKAFVCTVPTRIKLSHANLLDDEVKIAKVDEFLSDEIEFVNK